MRTITLLRRAAVGAMAIALCAAPHAHARPQNSPQSQTTTIVRGGTSTAPPTAKELDDAATPIVDFDSAGVLSPQDERVVKNRRYDNQNRVRGKLRPGIAAVMTEPPDDLSDMPAAESDLVVEGEVTDAAAFLSNDKGSVYSEFTLHVTDVLKADPGVQVKSGEAITAERWGGRVRYPDGRIIRYGVLAYGSPVRGGRYLLFLAEAGAGNYKILTGYEIRDNRVRALDGSRINHRGLGHWPVDKHNDQDYAAFRAEVDQAIGDTQRLRRSDR